MAKRHSNEIPSGAKRPAPPPAPPPSSSGLSRTSEAPSFRGSTEPALTKAIATGDTLVLALARLTQFGVPVDLQEALVHGSAAMGIRPGALAAAMECNTDV